MHPCMHQRRMCLPTSLSSSPLLSPTTQQIGLLPVDTRNPLEALIFGALISAVDPVATLSIIG